MSDSKPLAGQAAWVTGSSRGPKGIAGTHLKGGPRLTLTSYAGRILLHKK